LQFQQYMSTSDEDAADTDVKILTSVFTPVFVTGTFVDFRSSIKRENWVAVPAKSFNLVNAALLCWRRIEKLEDAFKYWKHIFRLWCKDILTILQL
jgi:hypothetical protein